MRDGRRRAPQWAIGAALAFGLGCGGGEDAAKTSRATPVRTYGCSLEVSKRTDGEYVGKGEGEDAAQAEAAAWTDVCAKLPEAERASCRDETKWSATKSSSSATAGETTTHTVTIQLVPIAPTFAGEASSEVSSAAACEAALAEACARAGAPGDCLSAGYEKKNEMITRTTRIAGS